MFILILSLTAITFTELGFFLLGFKKKLPPDALTKANPAATSQKNISSSAYTSTNPEDNQANDKAADPINLTFLNSLKYDTNLDRLFFEKFLLVGNPEQITALCIVLIEDK